MSEALYTRASTTDDVVDDDDEDMGTSLIPSSNDDDDDDDDDHDEERGAPPTTAAATSADNGPETRYRDDPTDLFAPASAGTKAKLASDKTTPKKKTKKNTKEEEDDRPRRRRPSDEYHFDAESEIPFSPVNLVDDDSDDDGEGEGEEAASSPEKNRRHRRKHDRANHRPRAKSNSKLTQRIFDTMSDELHDDDADRLHVGGGWGRHGSQTSLRTRCPCARRRYCCGAEPVVRYQRVGDDGGGGGAGKTSRGRSPGGGDGGPPLCRVAIASVALVVFVVACGYLGFEAGLPADDGTNETRGEEWLELGEEWWEHPREHWDHWRERWTPRDSDGGTNGAKGASGKYDPSNPNGVQYPYPASSSSSHALTSSQLLHLSEHVFQTCSERSLLSSDGRRSCIELCRGHFCCFEKDPAYGSCVADPYSYCFAYASCENVVQDFRMSNADAETKKGYGGMNIHSEAMKNLKDAVLNADDVKLLMETCSEGNVGTLDGIRDCNAFCEHHLCCFGENYGENCRRDHPGECQAYEACKILVRGPDGEDGDEDDEMIVVDSRDPDVIRTAVRSACRAGGTTPLANGAWVAQCHSVCANHLCCFSADGTKSNCRDVYGNEVCDAYSGCGVLFSETVDSPYVFPNGVGGVGDGNGNAASQAQAQESEGSGWESFEGAGQPMVETNNDNDNNNNNNNNNNNIPKETSQEQQFEQHQDDSIPDDVARVNKACTIKIERNPLLKEECRLACESRSCCYKTGPGNCYNLNVDWCDEFDACQLVYH